MQKTVYNILFREVTGTYYHFAKIWALTKMKSMKGMDKSTQWWISLNVTPTPQPFLHKKKQLYFLKCKIRMW